MLFWMFSLLGVYASAAGSQDFGFVCGFEPSREEGATGQIHNLDLPFYQSGTVRPLILFGKLKSPDNPFSLTQLKDRNGNKTQSSADLLNLDHVGSLAHYFNEMSYGSLTLEDNDDVNLQEPTLGDLPGSPPKPVREKGLTCWPVLGDLL